MRLNRCDTVATRYGSGREEQNEAQAAQAGRRQSARRPARHTGYCKKMRAVQTRKP